MRILSGRPSTVLLNGLATVAMLSACSRDTPTGVNDDAPLFAAASTAGVSVCHRSGSSGTIITVPRSEVAERLRHGDYLTSLAVAHGGDQPDDGAHFRRIGDAIAAARTGRLARGELTSAACRITITVAPGAFRGASADLGDPALELLPLTVDVPSITLRGALEMQLDADGRATGTSASHRATNLQIEAQAGEDNGTLPFIVAQGHPGGSAGHGLTVEGFAMEGPIGHGVFSIRVRDLTIQGNRFEAGLRVTLDLRATKAVIARNYFTGTVVCDMCLAGPGVYRVTGNSLRHGAEMGIGTLPSLDAAFASPVEVEPAPVLRAADVSAEITNNAISGHRNGLGAAIRIFGIGVGGSDLRNSSHITIRDNLVVNNTVAVRIDAGSAEPDTRLRSDVAVTLGDNVLRESCQTDLYVAFANPRDGTSLRNSTYRLALGGDVRFADAWFSNPAGFGNTLVVNGREIGHRSSPPLDGMSCPARHETGAQ